MTGKLATVTAVAVLVLATAASASAGFRIQEADPLFPKDVTVYWFQGGKARIDGALEGLTVIVDLTSGEGWLIESASKRYAGGTIAKVTELMKKAEKSMDSDPSPDDPAGKRVGTESPKSPAVSVRDLGAGEKLQGYDTRRYQVLIDGEVLEELWLAPSIQVSGEIDLVAFGTALQAMIGGRIGLIQGYEESEVYLNLRAAGYPLRQVLYFVGEKNTLEVTSVAMRDFPPADFAIPKGFSKVDYTRLLFGE